MPRDTRDKPRDTRDRFAAQRRFVALFDAGEEGIHVDMDDLPQAVGLGIIAIFAFAHAGLDSEAGCKPEP